VVRAAVFDLDGTLVDSLDDIASSLISALADLELAPPTLEQIRSWIGEGARVLVQRAVAHAGGGDVDRVAKRYGERYREAPVVATRVYDGMIPVLDRLDAAGVALAVLSNKPHDLTVRVVEQLLPGRFVEIAGQRPGGPLKPAAEAGLSVTEALGVPAAQCAMIGDSAIDVAAARAAGMRAVGVSWGLRPRDELASADAIADAPHQLIELLLV
jgi:phosphoglycolate phosphatase